MTLQMISSLSRVRTVRALVKPYTCRKCGLGFSRSSTRNIHMSCCKHMIKIVCILPRVYHYLLLMERSLTRVGMWAVLRSPCAILCRQNIMKKPLNFIDLLHNSTYHNLCYYSIKKNRNQSLKVFTEYVVIKTLNLCGWSLICSTSHSPILVQIKDHCLLPFCDTQTLIILTNHIIIQ